MARNALLSTDGEGVCVKRTDSPVQEIVPPCSVPVSEVHHINVLFDTPGHFIDLIYNLGFRDRRVLHWQQF